MSGGIVNCSPGTEHEFAPVDVEADEPATAAERLLLAGAAAERRMPVLGAALTRVEHELLCAVAVGVDVDEHHQPFFAKP